MGPPLSLVADAEALDGRLLFAIPKKGLSTCDSLRTPTTSNLQCTHRKVT